VIVAAWCAVHPIAAESAAVTITYDLFDGEFHDDGGGEPTGNGQYTVVYRGPEVSPSVVSFNKGTLLSLQWEAAGINFSLVDPITMMGAGLILEGGSQPTLGYTSEANFANPTPGLNLFNDSINGIRSVFLTLFQGTQIFNGTMMRTAFLQLAGTELLPAGTGPWVLLLTGREIARTFDPIPEPGSGVLLGVGLVGIAVAARSARAYRRSCSSG
jgi:hypothetical protein